MAEDTLFYRSMTATNGWRNPISGTGRTGFVNLVKDYAALNRKNMRHTDNKGYPLTYLVQVEAIGESANDHTVEIFTAPETWVLKNSVRKWHAARNMMLERVGQLGQIGEYGKTIRPYLSVAHATLGLDARPINGKLNHETTYTGGSGSPAYSEATSAAVVNTGMNGGEWTYTKVAATADLEEASAAGGIADAYHLVLTGDHNSNEGVDDGNHRAFTHVSMMRSYLESRRNASAVIQGTDGGGTIQAEPNPLVNLMADSVSVGEVKEIVQDIQREKPPYDSFTTTDDNALSTNDALDLVSKCLLSTSTSYLKDSDVIRVPMGLLHVRASASGAIGVADAKTPGIRIRLLGIEKCQG
jgi:hypothetical protein